MKKHVLAWLLFAATVSIAAPAAAQGTGGFQFGLTGGASVPIGDASDAFDTGYNGGLVLNYELPALPLGIRVDGDYRHFSLKTGATGLTGSSEIFDGNANVVVGLRIVLVKLYALGGVGVYNVKFSGSGGGLSASGSQTEFGWNAGFGVAFVAGKLSIFVEGRYHEISLEGGKFKFAPVSVGILF